MSKKTAKIFENIGKLIPGYSGYLDKEKARDTDYKLRLFVKRKLENFIEDASNKLGASLDCIINNAGITQDNLAIRMNMDEWKKMSEADKKKAGKKNVSGKVKKLLKKYLVTLEVKDL